MKASNSIENIRKHSLEEGQCQFVFSQVHLGAVVVIIFYSRLFFYTDSPLEIIHYLIPILIRGGLIHTPFFTLDRPRKYLNIFCWGVLIRSPGYLDIQSCNLESTFQVWLMCPDFFTQLWSPKRFAIIS